ncbi:sensor histidine kinase [Desulfobotulus sp.]|jgi:C4-dicarboxylate-specific signal transduction histidine kinase|uniref:sensor histidine kinase n=1 Tax=Desulfobotulus sp. TaxID=1940337 RepID=UPI002A35CBE1|nr:response regulator [Desulfobotulus sp.]MDY0164484.1 response regulator [Desulfobotulus sp.]
MRILIADDDIISRSVLTLLLQKTGHTVVSAMDGHEAWQVLQRSDAPRLAILDWMMPGMDGLQVVQRVRRRTTDQPPYLIMLTTKGDGESLVRALDAGADDYLSKPYNPEELRARIAVGERLVRMQETLATHAREMEALAQARTRQLLHADRMATLGALAAGIAHEINNPAFFIAGNAQTLQRSWDLLVQHLEATPLPKTDPQMAFVLEEAPRMLAGIFKGVDRISRIVKGLKGYAHRGSGEKSACHMQEILSDVMEFCQNVLKPQIRVCIQLPDTLPPVLANRQQIEQVLINLIRNAMDAMADCEGGSLKISGHTEGPLVCIAVADQGPGLPPEVLARIFAPFFTTKKAGEGTGLGLAISRSIMEEHGGDLFACNAPAGGAVFTLRLPAFHAAHALTPIKGDTP